MRDTILNPAGQTTTNLYDAADNRVATTYSDGITIGMLIGYDADDQRTLVYDGTGFRSWAWDSLHRLTAQTDGAGQTVAYTYDLAGRPTTITYPGSKTVTLTPDASGRTQTVADWLSHTTTYSYDPNSNPTTTTFGNSDIATNTYDAADRLMGIQTKQGSTTLANWTYTRDNADLLSGVTSTGVGPTETYTHNSLDQLATQASNSYSYDAADNLTQLANGTHQAFDDANQLCWTASSAASCASPPSGATTYGYDNRGNRTSMVTPTSGTWTYGYDQADRLTSAANPSGTPVSASYTYDGDGLRTAKTVNGTTTTYLWDHSRPLPVLIGEKTGTSQTFWINGPDGLPVEEIQPNGTTVRYLHHDQIGSTRLVTDQTGATIGTATYDPYGTKTSGTGVTTPLGYTGQYTDTETGYQYLHARYYDPSTGQFLTRDPLDAVTRSAYGYVAGSPLNGRDPSGLDWWDDAGDIAGEIADDPIGSLEDGWNSMSTGEQIADVALPVIAVGGLACAIAEPCGIAGATVLFGGASGEEAALLGQEGDETACTLEGLSASAQRSISSLEERIAEHSLKLQNYIANPDAYDNKGYLANAPSEAVRNQIIQGRIAHLQREIAAFQGAIDRLREGG